MKQPLVLSILAFATLVFSLIVPPGCTYESGIIDPPDIPIDTTVQVSFSEDIIPIFNKSCNVSGCHSLGGTPPDLTAANAYSELFNCSGCEESVLIDTLAPPDSELMLWLTGKRGLPMPLSGPDAEINSTVLTWITQGAKEN